MQSRDEVLIRVLYFLDQSNFKASFKDFDREIGTIVQDDNKNWILSDWFYLDCAKPSFETLMALDEKASNEWYNHQYLVPAFILMANGYLQLDQVKLDACPKDMLYDCVVFNTDSKTHQICKDGKFVNL
ncbi:MAG: hypothetical protein V4481_04830 [Patescibacteria group bacterium]